MTNRASLLCQFFLTALVQSCAFIGPYQDVEVLTKNDKTVDIDLTPRHFQASSHCVDALQVIPGTLLKSVAMLTPQQIQSLKWPERLRGYKSEDCKSFAKRGDILNDLNQIYADKSPRVGVILQENGTGNATNPSILQTIVQTMQKVMVTQGFASNSVIVKYVGKNTGAVQKAIAEMIYIDRVSLLIGGLTQLHASALTQLADSTQTPTLIVNPSASLGITAQSMRVYPPIKRLASKLLDHLLAQGVRQTVILYPAHANLSLLSSLKENPKSRSIQFSEATYDPDHPSLILAAVKSQLPKLAHTDGRPAVLIFDNFRMVRHIVNIISTSIPGRQVLFAGNQQWRSEALVTPRDDDLQGAVFVDFIGSYQNIPDEIEVPNNDNKYFTSAQAASRIDYEIIGYRLGTLAAEAARRGFSRHQIARRLQSINNKWDSYFPKSELAFDRQRESSWPVFLFEVTDESIRELN